MRASLQSRVLALAGTGVFIAVGALTLLGRSSLLSLEREVRSDHERLAASFARELSRAIDDDLRLVAGAAGVLPADLCAALRDIHRFGRLSSAAFAVGRDGEVIACEPALECDRLRPDLMTAAGRQAGITARPYVTDPAPHSDRLQRILAVIPARAGERGAVAALGVAIDPFDRRMAELLDAAEIAPTLQVRVRNQQGQRVDDPADDDRADGYLTGAPVLATSWTLELIDTGPDPVLPIASFRRQSLWLIPTFAAIAMLLGWGISRSVRTPLIALTAAAERIAHGDLGRPIDTRDASAGGDEVARLAVALERMRSDLQASIQTIERANIELEQKVHDRTRELARANASLEERERVRQALLRQVISAQEAERKRVARELHDETSQTLAALGIGVDVALAECGTVIPDHATHRLQDLRTLVDRMHRELHRMIVNLRPSVLDDLGLPAAIRWFVEQQVTPTGIAARCEFAGLDGRLPPDIETAIFRVVQEALNNVVRHAAAETVLIQASLGDGALALEIEDDGKGFDEGAVVLAPGSMQGIGLMGIRERVEILGGTVRIESQPGSGTRIAVDVPINGAER